MLLSCDLRLVFYSNSFYQFIRKSHDTIDLLLIRVQCYQHMQYVIKKKWNIFKESRQRGRFAGFSLYISNTGDRSSSSLFYKDGPALPPLNFTTTCTLSGRYVIFYNERFDGVTYPVGYEVEGTVFMELCEVTVNGKLRTSIKIKFMVVRKYRFPVYCELFIKKNIFSTGILAYMAKLGIFILALEH